MTHMSSLMEPSKINQMKLLHQNQSNSIKFPYPVSMVPFPISTWGVSWLGGLFLRDSPLTALGRSQARRLGDELPGDAAGWWSNRWPEKYQWNPVQRWLGGWSDSELLSIFTGFATLLCTWKIWKWLLNLKLELLTDRQKEHSSKSSWV